MEEIKARIKQLLAKSFDMKPEEINLAANLKTDLQVDSLEMVEVLVALEKEFKIKVNEGEITSKHSVNDVAKIIQDKLNQ